VVFVREAIAEELESRQVHGAGGEQIVDDGEALAEPRRQDAAVGFALAHAKVAGGVAGLDVESAVFDLGEVGDELGEQRAVGAEQLGQVREQVVIREMIERHAPLRITVIFVALSGVVRAFWGSIETKRIGLRKRVGAPLMRRERCFLRRSR
jgi:hypothetical protein